MYLLKKNLWLALFLTVLGLSATIQAQTSRDLSQYNLDNGLALKGYDPVSYFPEGGSLPLQGSEQFNLNYRGTTYLFASTEDREQFQVNPEKYEPTYGGWCAYAMASGAKVDIQPTLYTINGNRLHFFVSSRAKRNFDRNVTTFEMRADDFWMQISGEPARF